MKLLVGLGLVLVACLSGCAWIQAHDPRVPVDDANYQTCPGGQLCLRDGFQCPAVAGNDCEMLPVLPCAAGVCYEGRVPDAGTREPQ